MKGEPRERRDGSSSNFHAAGFSRMSADEIVLGYSKTSSSFVSRGDPSVSEKRPGSK